MDLLLAATQCVFSTFNLAYVDLRFLFSDPRTNGRAHIQPAEDVYTRIRNFDSLVRAVKGFYEVKHKIYIYIYVYSIYKAYCT